MVQRFTRVVPSCCTEVRSATHKDQSILQPTRADSKDEKDADCCAIITGAMCRTCVSHTLLARLRDFGAEATTAKDLSEARRRDMSMKLAVWEHSMDDMLRGVACRRINLPKDPPSWAPGRGPIPAPWFRPDAVGLKQ